jgi:hypothetical protein
MWGIWARITKKKKLGDIAVLSFTTARDCFQSPTLGLWIAQWVQMRTG